MVYKFLYYGLLIYQFYVVIIILTLSAEIADRRSFAFLITLKLTIPQTRAEKISAHLLQTIYDRFAYADICAQPW